MAYTVDEASALLGIPRPTLYRYLRDYSIPHVRRSGRIYVPEDSFERIREARDLHREGLGTQSVRRKLREGEELDARAVMERLDRISVALEGLKAGGPDPAVRTLLARQSLLVSAVSDLTAMLEEVLAANGRRPKVLADPEEETSLVLHERPEDGRKHGGSDTSPLVPVRASGFGVLARRRRRGVLAAVLMAVLCAVFAATALGAGPAVESVRQAILPGQGAEPPSSPAPPAPPSPSPAPEPRPPQQADQATETRAKHAGAPVEELVLGGVPEDERERVSAGLRGALRAAGGYGGQVGFWVVDLEGGWGYGLRPDEPFSGVSAVKAAVMVSVYRKLETGELSSGETLAVTEEDLRAAGGGSRAWAAGDAWTVGDYLWMMVVESDPVAAAVLVRAAGGPGYVEGVARSLGAEDTDLGQGDGIGASTPRDVALVLEAVNSGQATPEDPQGGRAALLELMAQEEPGWGSDGSPGDAAVVGYAERPYVVAVLGEGGDDVRTEALGEISEAVWAVQNPGLRPDA